VRVYHYYLIIIYDVYTIGCDLRLAYVSFEDRKKLLAQTSRAKEGNRLLRCMTLTNQLCDNAKKSEEARAKSRLSRCFS
jgi:hypothetical protein